MKKPVENWFYNAVIDGLSIMMILRLKNTPAEDSLEALADTWIFSLWNCGIGWREDIDLERLQFAFKTIGNNCDYFPAPKTFLEHLQPRKPCRAPQLGVERGADMKQIAVMQAIVSGVIKKTTLPKGVSVEDVKKGVERAKKMAMKTTKEREL